MPSIRSLDVWSGKDLLQSEFIKSARQQLANYQLIVFLDYGFDMEMARRVRPFTNAKIVLFLESLQSRTRGDAEAGTR